MSGEITTRMKGEKVGGEGGGTSKDCLQGRGKLVLVVENDLNFCQKVVPWLWNLGYVVALLPSGTGGTGLLSTQSSEGSVVEFLIITGERACGGFHGRRLTRHARHYMPGISVLVMAENPKEAGECRVSFPSAHVFTSSVEELTVERFVRTLFTARDAKAS